MKKLLLIVALLAFAAGCEKQEELSSSNPVIEVASTTVGVSAEARSGIEIRYTLRIPSDEGMKAVKLPVETSTTTGWIRNLVCNDEGDAVTFGVEANTDTAERTGTIVLSFSSAEDVQVKVIQSAANGDDGDDDDDGDGDDDDNKGGNTPEYVYRTGWPELPVEQSTVYSNSTLYYAHHICPDVYTGSDSHKARNYTVCFSSEHHCPVWVAAPRHKMYEGSVNRSDAYQPDPDIPSNIQYQQKTAGNSTYNRGHMLGSAERTVTRAVNEQVFYYTNIAPQETNSFNNGGGAWNTLEDWVDGKICADTTYVVIGTHFDAYTDGYGYSASPKKITYGGRSDVSCPTMFYYILLRTKKGNTGKSVAECSADELMCAAFVRSHNCAKGTKVSRKEMMSVAELEKLTGFVYFPNVPNAPKETFNASEWGL